MELVDRKSGVTKIGNLAHELGFSAVVIVCWDENGHFDCFAAPVINEERLRVVTEFLTKVVAEGAKNG